jgi:hypothetical protein
MKQKPGRERRALWNASSTEPLTLCGLDRGIQPVRRSAPPFGAIQSGAFPLARGAPRSVVVGFARLSYLSSIFFHLLGSGAKHSDHLRLVCPELAHFSDRLA